MIALLGVELTRLRWRRAVLVLLGLVVAATAVIFVGVALESRTKSIDELAADYGPQVADDVERCAAHPRQYGLPASGDVRAACEAQVAGFYTGGPLNLTEQRESGSGPALVALLMVTLLLVGTTFVGHDWNTGSMGNQLLFEPRRLRVWAAKGAAVGLVAGAVSLAVLVAYWTGLWAVAAARDVPIGEHAVSAAYKQAVLGGVFVAGAAVLGYALTMLLRTTVGSLGLLLGTTFLGIVVVWTGYGQAERFMPWSNFAAYVVGSYTYYSDCSTFDCTSVEHTITRSDGAVYFLVLLLVVALVSVQSFRRRDVP